MTEKPDPQNEPGVDMTELAAAIARLNGKKPPSGPVIVPASTFPVTDEINRKKAAAAAKEAEILAAEVGQKMKDGTIYAGSLPTGEKIFSMPEDIGYPADRRTMTFNQAAGYVEKLNDENHLGHNDWRIPTTEELNVLYQSKDEGALKDTFNVICRDPYSATCHHYADWYWSASLSLLKTAAGENFMKTQHFSNGYQRDEYCGAKLSARIVRSELPKP